MKRLSMFLAFVLATAIAVVGIATAKTQKFKSDLSGPATSASGQATFEVTGAGGAGAGGYGTPEGGKMGTGAGGAMGGTLTYKLDLKNIENVTTAHLHMGKKTTEEGQVIAPLYLGPQKSGEFSGRLAQGTITDKDLVGPLSGKTISDLVKLINSGDVYVNVHTMKHPEGELRGTVG